jgi:hypothetical protein
MEYSPQEKPHSRFEEIGTKLVGVTLADSFLVSPIYAIWTVNDIWSYGINDSYEQIIGVGLLFNMIGMAILLILHSERYNVDNRAADNVFVYFLFSLMILSLLAVPVWSPWALGRVFGSWL